MSIKIDKETCIGCGTCVGLCPSVFGMDDDGKAKVISEDDLECAKNAESACPVESISIE
ncbi:ferredoxin [bacterium]|nr:ferredoxin [bacterium]